MPAFTFGWECRTDACDDVVELEIINVNQTLWVVSKNQSQLNPKTVGTLCSVDRNYWSPGVVRNFV